MRWSTWGILLSAALHVGVAAAVVSLPKGTTTRRTTVAVVDKKKKRDDKKDDKREEEPPPPPPKPVEPPKKALPKPRVPENTPPPPPAAPPPPVAAAPHPVLNALPNLGISMAGGPGGGGIAVPQGQAGAPATTGTIEAAKPPPRPSNECSEDAVKPKMLGSIAQDRIMAAAQAAGGVEGKIRLELQVDETGNVTSVRVTGGLGGAIDEAALAAAKRVKFNPGTKCGRPVAATFRITVTVRNPD